MKWFDSQTGLLVISFAALLLAPLVVRGSYPFFVLCLCAINIVAVLGLNFIFGFTGQMNLGLAGFLAIGGYTTGILSTRLGWSFWAAAGTSVLVVAAFSLLLGIPTLRLKRYYLAIMTIGFTEIIRYLLMNSPALTGGVFGVSNIPRPHLGRLSFEANLNYYYLTMVSALILTVVARLIEESRFGRAFKAVRDDELAAEALGLSSTAIKVLAFVLCGVYSAVAGSLYAGFQGYLSPELYVLAYSFSFVSMLVIGGLGSIPGAVIGAVTLTVLVELLRPLKQWYLVFYAASIIAVIAYWPNGITGFILKRPSAARHVFSKPVLRRTGA